MSEGESRESAAEWFVAGPNRKPFGPYTIEKLREYIADGRLTRTTLVHRRGTEAWVPAERIPGLFPGPSAELREGHGAAPQPTSRATASAPVAPTCPTCRTGSLISSRIYRMSMPVVVIGYILLVPSLLGIALTVLHTGLLIVWPLVQGSATGDTELQKAGLLFAPCAAVSGVCGVVACFVFGLLGWLLIMTKKVLRCSACGATVDAA